MFVCVHVCVYKNGVNVITVPDLYVLFFARSSQLAMH